MRKIISFMHVSLDGFVAGPNGELNWVTVNEEIFDFVGNRIRRCAAALYGRVTYEMMESYWPTAGEKPNASKHDIEHSKWYAGARKLVISKSLQNKQLPNTEFFGDNLEGKIKSIQHEEGEDILLFGSPTATHSLMKLNLIDGFWLFLNPIILGEGMPLFKNIKEKTKLKLQSSHLFECGVMELNYEL